jgi:hypothetical protein
MVVAIECCHLATQKRVKENNSKMGIKIEKTTGGDFPAIDLGWVEARIVELEARPEGQYGPQVLWKLETLEERPGVAWDAENKEVADAEPVEPGLSLWGWTSQKYSDFPSKLYRWTRSVLGADFDPDAPFDSSDLIGRVARAKVDVYTVVKSEPGEEDVVQVKNKVLELTASKKYAGQVLDSEAVTAPVEDEDIPF